jgi:hypothetical protein
MVQNKFGFRRLLGAGALCGGMAIVATGVGAGVASADPWFPPPPPGPAAVGTASAASVLGPAASSGHLHSVPSVLTVLTVLTVLIGLAEAK